MPSFDVVSEVDSHELTNAVDQASRELAQRFDFKGTDAVFELEETTVTMTAPADFQLKQMLEILKLRVAKRGIDIACLEVQDPEVNLARAKQLVVLKHGIDAETGRKVSRLLKDSKLKVQAQVQGDKVRVTGKKRDDLQEAIAYLRKAEVGVPLQFNNFRD
jgi:uncharacterized protein YajQ (UPF0234 family)